MESVKLEDFIGFDSIVEGFSKRAENNSLSHAHLIVGPDGIGKSILAKIFSLKILNKSIDRDYVDIVKYKPKKASFGVDEVRAIIEEVNKKPYEGNKKVIIIYEGNKLTVQAQNALLKTIEEPPHYAVILLLTENVNTFLPTILSRCVTLQLKPVAPQLIKKYLMEQLSIPDYLAELSASFSQGNVGKAIRYASSEEFSEIKKDTVHMLKHVDEMKNYEIVQFIKSMAEKKKEVYDYLDLMLLWYRDVLMFKVTQDTTTASNPNNHTLLFSSLPWL